MEKKKRRKKERTIAKRYRSYLLEYRYNHVQEDYASSKECGVEGRGGEGREDRRNRTLSVSVPVSRVSGNGMRVSRVKGERPSRELEKRE